MAMEAKVQLKSSNDQIFEVEQVKVQLKSSDNQIFEVEQVVAFESETVKQMIEDMGEESIVPLPNVRGNILAKVIEYCKFHVEAAKTSAISEEDVKKWDQAFVQVDVDTLMNIVLAANYMNLNNLLDLTTQSVADIMKERTPEEVRTMFNIKNDFTPEEEDKIRNEYQWAFE